MPNEMQNRLIDIFNEIHTQLRAAGCSAGAKVRFADTLIEKGVIVLPCRVGQTVYKIEDLPDEDFCGECEEFLDASPGNAAECCIGHGRHMPKECVRITEITAELRDIYFWLYLGLFGEKVFLTREEAEEALQKWGTDNG